VRRDGGTFFRDGVVRLNSDFSVDRTFGTDGIATGPQHPVVRGLAFIAQSSDGRKIVVAGNDGVSRTSPDGFPFSVGFGAVWRIAIDATPTAELTAKRATIFTVVYRSSKGIDVSTLDGRELRVIGPASFVATPKLIGVKSSDGGKVVTATYSLKVRAGTAAGTYRVVLQAGQVLDLAGSANERLDLGSFVVNDVRRRIGGDLISIASRD
jgi:hypothetical protein